MNRVIFGTFDVLAPALFWPIFLDLMDQKMARSKKVVIIKNQFFYARQPREGISQLFARASTSVHIVTGTFTSKLFDLISSF